MNRSKIFYGCFLLPLFSLFYNLTALAPDNSNLGEENIHYISEPTEYRTDCVTPEELAKLISEHKFSIKSKNVKKKVLHKKNSWNKLIAITGDVKKDFNNVISLLEKSKDTNWDSWKLMPKTDPVIIRSDYITQINGYKVCASFVTYAETKETFLQNAWVVTE